MVRKGDFVDSDYFLIKKMKKGEEDAFDVFVRKYYSSILQYCMYRCRDEEMAKDITQDTFVRFFTKLSDYTHLGKRHF